MCTFVETLCEFECTSRQRFPVLVGPAESDALVFLVYEPGRVDEGEGVVGHLDDIVELSEVGGVADVAVGRK